MQFIALTLSPTLRVCRKLVAKYSTISSFSSKTAMWILQRPEDEIDEEFKSFVGLVNYEFLLF